MKFSMFYNGDNKTLNVMSDTPSVQQMFSDGNNMKIRVCPGCMVILRKDLSEMGRMNASWMLRKTAEDLSPYQHQMMDEKPAPQKPADADCREEGCEHCNNCAHDACGTYISPCILEKAGIDPDAILNIAAEPGVVVITAVDEDEEEDCEDGEEENDSLEETVLDFLCDMEEDEGLDLFKLADLLAEELEPWND